jgi:hypothetical protein
VSSQDGTIGAAVHAGWRGIVAGIIPAAIARMLREAPGMGADSLLAAIGPCISRAAYVVGPDVLEEFARVFSDDAPIQRSSDGRGNADLAEAARRQLLNCGLNGASIDTTDRCTYTHAEEFFSHRRDRGVTGRMAAVIAANA